MTWKIYPKAKGTRAFPQKTDTAFGRIKDASSRVALRAILDATATQCRLWRRRGEGRQFHYDGLRRVEQGAN